MRCLLSFLLVVFVFVPFLAEANTPPRVLMISSYHPAFPTFFKQIRGIKEVLDTAGVDLDVEFMDTKRFYDDTNFANFTQLLTYKLEKLPPYDVLVVADDNALVYAVEHRDTIFKDIPIVFLGINNIDYAVRQSRKLGMTGVLEAISMEETLDLMRQIIPENADIVAVVDKTKTGEALKEIFIRAMRNRDDARYHFFDYSTLTWSEVATEASRIQPENGILFLAGYEDINGHRKGFEEGFKNFYDNVNSPIFYLWDYGMGSGMTGGKVVSFTIHGRLAGELVMKILDGAQAKKLPLISGDSANAYTFDSSALKRFNIDPDILPAGSIFYNYEPTFFLQHMSVLLKAGAIILLLMALITYLLKINRAKDAAEQRVRESEKKYRTYIESAPDAIILCDGKGVIATANPAASRLTGYELDELVGMSMLTAFIPPSARLRAAQRFMELKKTDSMSAGTEILNKAGKTIFVLLDVIKLDDDTFLGYCKDLTEEKRTLDALEKSEELFRGVLEQAGDAVFVFSEDGTLQFVNGQACRSLGYSREDLLKLRVWEIDPMAGSRRDMDLLWGKSAVVFETLHKRKDGTTFPVEMKLDRVIMDEEKIMLGLARDLSTRNVNEKQRQMHADFAGAYSEIVPVLTAPDGTTQKVAELVYKWAMQITGANYAYVGSLEPTDGSLLIYNITAMQGAGCNIKAPTVLLPKRDGIYPAMWGHSLNTGEPFYTNAARGHKLSEGLPEGHIPVQKFLSVPCRYEGEIVGQISVANPDDDFVDQDVRSIEVLAELFALAVYRKRSESELIKARPNR
ncbi:MAG: PAS domain S-box protein [Pseudodesulfovibrio sp.]